MARISIGKRRQVIEKLNAGFNQSSVSRMLGISRYSVQMIQKKYSQGFGLLDKPKSGRPTKLSLRMQRSIIVNSKKDPFKTAKQLSDEAKVSNIVSVDTVKRLLRHNNLNGRIATRKPALNHMDKKKRFTWCKQRLQWSIDDWNKIIFSDESKIELYPRRQQFVRIPKGARLKPKYLKGTSKFTPSIMVWGAIRNDGTKVLVRCNKNVNSLEYQRLLSLGLPKIYNTRKIFQQDCAPSHTSKSTCEYLERKMIRVLPNWPPKSPDLNIIEGIWNILKSKVQRRSPNNLEDLWHILNEEWDKITQDEISKFYQTLPRRVKAICSCKGGSTKY
jgi:transposase